MLSKPLKNAVGCLYGAQLERGNGLNWPDRPDGRMATL